MKKIIIISIIAIVVIIIIIIMSRQIYLNHTNSPVLIPNISDGTTEYFFSQNKLTLPPINGGHEYSFSFWLYISNWSYKYGLEKIIAFWRGTKPASDSELTEKCREIVDDLEYGDDIMDEEGSTSKKPLSIKETCKDCDSSDLLEDFSMPQDNYDDNESDNEVTRLTGILISLGKNNNQMVVRHTLIDGTNETLVVEDLPIQKWLNVSVILQLRNLDVFINGELKASLKFKTLPTYQSGNLFVNPNGGFQGYLSKFQYYNRKIDINEIRRNFRRGPKNRNPLSNNKVGQNISNSLGDIGSKFNNTGNFKSAVKRTTKRVLGQKFLLNQVCHNDNDCEGSLECLQGKCSFGEEVRKLGEECYSNSDCQTGLNCNNYGSQHLSATQIKDLVKLGIPVKEGMTYDSSLDKKPFTCIYPE